MALAQVLGDIIGDVGNAAYTPEPNSTYGAKKYTPVDYAKATGLDKNGPQVQQLFGDKPHIWLNPKGEDTTYEVENLRRSPDDQFIKPGFWTKLFSSNARDISMENAQAEVNPTLQNAFSQAKSFGSTGAPTIMGSLGGQSNINEAHRMLEQSKAALNRSPVVEATNDAELSNRLAVTTGSDPLAIQHQINQLRTQLGQDLTEGQILDNINQIKLGTTGQERTDLPTTMGTIAGEDAQRNLAANYFSDPLASIPYLDRYIPGKGIQTSGGELSTMYRPPAAALIQAVQRGAYNGRQPTPTSTGQAFIKPNVGDNIMPPTIGNIGQQGQQSSRGPDWLNNANANMVTLDKYPEITVDTNSGRIYTKDGHDITNDPRVEPIKQAAIQQLQEQEKDKKESAQDAAQATIARKMAVLKEQQKHLQAEHKRSGWLPAAAQAYETGSPNNPLGVQMIGKPAEWLGKATSNYHPINRIKSWDNELIGE